MEFESTWHMTPPPEPKLQDGDTSECEQCGERYEVWEVNDKWICKGCIWDNECDKPLNDNEDEN